MKPFVALALALLLAGCAGDEAPPTATPSPTFPADDPVAWPIALEGRLAQGVSACSLTCVSPAVSEEERIFETEAFGTVEMELTLEWEAAAPTTQELHFGVFTCDPDACASDDEITFVASVAGPSPLFFESREVVIPEGERLFIFASASPAADTGGSATYVSNGEALSVTGEIETA